jgi:hypothetical protein
MNAKNINQNVDTTRYGSNFENIFGKKSSGIKTGTYIWDPAGKCMVKIDDSTPKSVREAIYPLMPGVRAMKSIPVTPKEIEK